MPFGTLAKGVKVPTEQLFHEQFCLGGVSGPNFDERDLRTHFGGPR